MKTINLKSKRLLGTIFFCISFAIVAFVFQGCRMLGDDGDYCIVRITGTVKSKTTDLPIKGIKIDAGNRYLYGLTDENGNFEFHSFASRLGGYNSGDDFYKVDTIKIKFLDIDSINNGYFADTTIIINPTRISEVEIFMKMEEK